MVELFMVSVSVIIPLWYAWRRISSMWSSHGSCLGAEDVVKPKYPWQDQMSFINRGS